MKDLLLRTSTGITLVILFTGSILLGPSTFLLMILVIYGLSIRELYKLFSIRRGIPGALAAGSGFLLIMAVYACLHLHLSPLWLILPAALWTIGYSRPGYGQTATLALFWLAIPLASYLSLGWFPDGVPYRSMFPLSVIILVWIHDMFAYLTGSLLGKHPMTPRLSPGKTWEGFAGGMIFTLFSGWILFRITGTFTAFTWLFSALIISLLGLTGDLFESGMKRKMNVKDTGHLLPGHGGILDRFDSLLFVAPALLLLLLFLNLFQ